MKHLVAKPAALRPGDRIALVLPSGPVDPVELSRGRKILEDKGFIVDLPAASPPFRIFAASDQDRYQELSGVFADPGVRAVWAARGGYGMNRILPRLDAAWLRAHPKLVIGFSDATALLTHQVQRAGVAAIHGPMVAHDLVREAEKGGLRHLLEICAGRADWQIPIPTTLRAGRAEGPVAGGCLSVLASLAGTPAAVSFAGRIALLEDHFEAPQRRIDRLLIQLRQSGAFDGVRGIFFGVMHECGNEAELAETILDCLGDLGVPIGFGAPVGHGPSHLAIPFGIATELVLADSAGGRLLGRESAVTG
ncbi:MAG: LD-carboxypeptidase [Deltaproteobacteria bacterium]